MSSSGRLRLDPAPPTEGQLLVHSTDGVPVAQRLAYWREGVMRRMVPLGVEGTANPFRGRMRRIVGDGLELIEFASEDVVAVRSPERCRIDGCDDITIDLMRRSRNTWMDHGGAHRVNLGDLYLVDYAKPSEVRRGAHCTVGLTMSRRLARDVLGDDIAPRAGMKFQASGLARVLCRHLQATFDEAGKMAVAERAAAAKAAKDMVLALLQATHEGMADPERFARGFHQAALALIDHECGDPNLAPERIAIALGCSRASLYRAFAKRDESVSAAIWQARLDRAWRMLRSPEGIGLLISEVAALSGFREMPTFTRMFKRRYGMTPRDARENSRSG
ncbi:MAG: helix-turn-helix domain-containing protein [Reyranella sp.]|uniref:helix-turn-helix domain-containing protein n=1 Tax=Reyranella sp. TaxID=1929291 RepID=UPI0012023B7A|nr:helix-turn-helix domain-containing protein [Reyranella sp.]TAJ38635.1 MAG: helix-turn-helix domain-containing protein [Reyranella sp.]